MNRIIPIRVASWMFSPLVWSTAGEFRRPLGFLRWSCRPQLLQLSVLPCGTYHRRFWFGAALSFPLCSFTVLKSANFKSDWAVPQQSGVTYLNPFTPKLNLEIVRISTIICNHLSIWLSYEKPSSSYWVISYLWWSCWENLALITLGSERVNL